MIALARLAGIAAAGAAALLVAAASHVPLRVHPSPDARLRVAFSARPERVESCRTLGADELAELPQHMRQSVVCEGATARYRLQVLIDDSLALSTVLRGGGLRRDRRLYALHELPLPSAPVVVEVRLARLDSTPAAPPPPDAATTTGAPTPAPASRGEEERRRRQADEVPASLLLRETVTLAPREVLLVTYDQGARRLHAVRGPR